jgi:type IV secretion system protein VirD4
MLDSDHGLILGRIRTRRRFSAAVQSLFTLQIPSFQACRESLDVLRGPREAVVRLPQAIHTAVFAPSGVGKGVSCVIPFLLDCRESCVVIDFKGENARLTAEHRRKVLGQQVVLLDPYGVLTPHSDGFNPLEAISATNPAAIDDCNDLAKALVVRSPDEKEPHWNDSAEAWIAAFLAMVVAYGEAHDARSLQTVRDLFSTPERLELALRIMHESPAWDGMLARMGGQLSHFVEREKSSTLSTVARHLRFLDTPAIAAITRQSSFDPAILLDGNMTIYLILPPEHMRAQAGLLRMWLGSLLRVVVRGGVHPHRQVHFLCDEAASLGSLDVMDDAVDKYRGYGVRLQFYFQSLGQLQKCFPHGQDVTLLGNTTQIYFGANDTATAEMVSTRLGEQTIVVESGGGSSGTSWQQPHGGQVSQSMTHSRNTSHNWQPQARKLLKPEEVAALPPDVAITFVPGLPPLRTRLLRYYEEPTLGRNPRRRADVLQSGRALFAALVLLVVCAGTAAVLTVTVSQLPGV